MIFGFLFLFATAHAQSVHFESAALKVGGERIQVRVADDDARRMHGLMFERSLPANDGMLFVFDEERELGFWMKNTLIPLSIGFFDAQGVLVDAQEMVPPASMLVKDPPSYRSRSPALFALEMNAGWFSKHHVKNGALMRLLGPTRSALLRQKLSSAGPSSGTIHPSSKPPGG